MYLRIALFFVTLIPVAAQTPQVPHKLPFAGMTLTIREDARKEIQKDVDALTQSPRHFDIKVERAKTYFPIIEKIFTEENLPRDFKFLVLQESALIPDAVSVSDAVGFWQFKDFTAAEMGLRVDKEVDERMNIVSSTRAAARYLKKNNSFFNNWLYALQAYQMGAGGVMRSIEDTHGGAKHMEVTSATYWYVKKFLAHKIAFEEAVKGTGKIEVTTYENKARKSLGEIATAVTVNEDELKALNKWLKATHIPDDKMYAVTVPIRGNGQLLSGPIPTVASLPNPEKSYSDEPGKIVSRGDRIKINGVVALMALEAESAAAFSSRAGIDLSYFLKCNDQSISDRLIPGRYYFIAEKRARATEAYHKVTSGETLWEISQQYGVKLKKLKRFNRLESNAVVKEGMTLWLSSIKPKDGKVPAGQEAVEVDERQTFNWSADAAATPALPPRVENQQPVADRDLKQIETVAPALKDSSQALAHTAKPDTAAAIELVVEPPPSEHVVQPGETLYSISKKYGLEVEQLLAWNGLKLEDGIMTGQPLSLHETAKTGVGTSISVSEVVHEVKPTDTLYSIARKYGVTIKELMDWNSKKDFNLTPGERLKILRP
jgi:membrane-bound lytic murein transglycosylase D